MVNNLTVICFVINKCHKENWWTCRRKINSGLLSILKALLILWENHKPGNTATAFLLSPCCCLGHISIWDIFYNYNVATCIWTLPCLSNWITRLIGHLNLDVNTRFESSQRFHMVGKGLYYLSCIVPASKLGASEQMKLWPYGYVKLTHKAEVFNSRLILVAQ